MEQPEITLIFPFYNESKRLNNHLVHLKQYLAEKEKIEVLYVDDGSTDATLANLKSSIESLKNDPLYSKIIFTLHSYAPNKGKGGAVREGMLRGSGKFLLFTDFDCSISLREIDRFYSIAKKKNGPAIVVASRKENSVVLQRQSLLRRVMGRSFNHLMKFIINLPIKDTQCGFKLFDSTSAKFIFPIVHTRGFAFDVEVLKIAQLNNIPIMECGVEISHDDINSTVNIYIDPIKMLWDLFKLRISLLFNRKHYLSDNLR